VRNGHTRDTDERFLTVKDLKDGIAISINGGRSGAGGGAPDTGSAANAVGQMLTDLVDSITSSRLWLLLGSRIQRIEMPEWFRGRFGAEVRTVQNQITNATNALAEQITTAITNVAGNVAIAQQELRAVSDLTGATAEALTRLQVDVFGPDGITANAETALRLAGGIEGTIKGSWTVKFDIYGYVTGIGLGVESGGGSVGGTPISTFGVRADRFFIGSPADQNAALTTYNSSTNVPFIVVSTPQVINGRTYYPGTYINTAFIHNAHVDTLHIAGQAVITPVTNTSFGGALAQPTFQDLVYATVVIDGVNPTDVTYLSVSGTANILANGGAPGPGGLNLRISSGLAGGERGLVQISLPQNFSGAAATQALFAAMGNCSVTFALQGSAPADHNGDTWYTWGQCGITVLSVKR
jgi:hypothetical protein